MALFSSSTEFLRFKKLHSQRTSYAHWQLRDLIQVWQDDIYSVRGKRVIKYSPDNSKVQALVDLPFDATCLAANEGYLALGGNRNELAVFELGLYNNPTLLYSSLSSGSVNNAVHITPSADGDAPMLFVCNNDQTISIFSLPHMNLVSTVHCGAPVNYCALSPDSSRLVAVCDNFQTQLYTRDSVGNYTKSFVHRQATDAGICCDWNYCGSCYAAGTQDNFLRIYDSRTNKMEAAVPSMLDAVRTVKFSKSPMDLVAFSEHRRSFNVLDARMFMDKQVVEAASHDEEITGLAFDGQGSRLYLGMTSGIQEYAVDVTARLSQGGCEWI